MTLHQQVDAMLSGIAFAAPVSPEDCAVLRDALRSVLPESKIEVYCNKNEAVVVHVDNLRRVIEVT